MYVATDVNYAAQKCYHTEEQMTDMVIQRVKDIVGEDVSVEFKEIHITHARVFINGENTHCDFKLLFPKSHIEWDASESDPLATMRKKMSEGIAECI